MQKHFYIGLGILALFLVLGFLVSFCMDRVCVPLSAQLENAAREALSGDLEKGISLAADARNRWSASRKSIATVADHTPMDEIEELFAEIAVFAQAGDGEHFSACCARLSALMEAMAEAHRLNWQNFL